MCLICVEYQAERLSANQAWKNLDEMTKTIGEEHTAEVIELIWDEYWDVMSDLPFEPSNID